MARWFAVFAVFLPAVVTVGCACHDNQYVYHFEGALLSPSGVAAAHTRFRLEIETRPQPEAEATMPVLGRSDWISSNDYGQFEYRAAGAKWTSCSIFEAQPFDAPPVTALRFSVEQQPDRWTPLALNRVSQHCAEMQCWLSLGSVAIGAEEEGANDREE